MALHRVTVLLFMAVLLAVTGLPHQALAAKRLALVVGIDSYREIPKLQKAVGDARAMSATLKSLGFEVTTVLDADRRTLNRSVAEFQSRLAAGDIALVHFSGHGVELDGQNYLLPSDVPKPRANEKDFVKSESLGLAALMERVAASGARTRIFIIDACRDNPFAQSGVRGVGTSRGLARVEAPAGTFIMYSAGYGQQALDRLGEGDAEPTSVYTRVLLRELTRQGKQISEMARDVRLEVERLARSLGHEQRPAYYDELSAGFYFAGAPEAGGGPTSNAGVSPPIRTPPDALNEQAAFETAKSIGTEAAWEAFIARFPTGFYADMAKAAREKLQAQTQLAALAADREDIEELVREGYLGDWDRDRSLLARLYGAQVTFENHGTLAREEIVEKRHVTVPPGLSRKKELAPGTLSVRQATGNRRYEASFRYTLTVQDSNGGFRHESEVDLTFDASEGRPQIVTEKTRTISTAKLGPTAAAPPPQERQAQPGGHASSYWSHNGSVVYLVADGNKRSFYYHRPRSGMLQAGARPHDLLFEGWKEGNSYRGTAYLFSSACGKAAYQVSGSVQNGDRRVVMQGTAPRRDNSCRAVSYFRDNLVFDYMSLTPP